MSLKERDFFIKEEEVCREIGILTQGYVRSYIINEESKEYTKTLFATPEVIGSYVSLVTQQSNRLSQKALTDCEMIKIPLYNIEKLSVTHIEMERLRRRIGEQLYITIEKRELEIALLDAEERYLLFRKQYPDAEF